MPRLILVTGGRDFSDRKLIYDALDAEMPTFLIEGQAKGADSIAGQWCQDRGVDYIEVPALWSSCGKKAGARRNKLMLRLLCSLAGQNEKLVVAFPGKIGTPMMIAMAESAGVKVVRYGNHE